MLKLQFTIDAVDKATSKLTGINKAVERTVERLGAPYRKLRASINSLVESGGLERVQGALAGVRERFAALPLLATAAAGGVAAAMLQTIRRVDQLVDSSKTLGVPIEQLQRLGFAAQMSGSSREEMGSALQFLSMNMVEAISGSKEMQQSFRHVGLEVQQLRKMNAVQVFEAIADKFEKVGDAGQNAERKIALTRALMGRGGAAMVQMLNQGSKAFQELYAEADRLGVISADQAGRFASAADALDRMAFGANGFLSAMTSAALPALERVVQRFTEMGEAGRGALAERIGTALGRFIEKLPDLLTKLAAVASGIAVVLGYVDAVASAFGGWGTFIGVVATAIAGKAVWALALFTKGVWALGAAIAATPLGAFLLVVGGIAAAAYLIYENWEPIKQWFADLWASIVAGVNDVVEVFGKLIPGWMMGGAIGPRMVGAAPSRPSAVAPTGGTSNRELGGTLKIEIDGDGKPRVRELRTAPGSAINFDVYTGSAMGMP